jgi:fimbrial chaperone protein
MRHFSITAAPKLIAIFFVVFAYPNETIVFANSFQVAPIRINLAPNESSTLLSVRNEAKDRLRVQVSVSAWDENKSGEMVLMPTEEIVFYPTLLTINPGDRRNVRVGTKNAVVEKEKSYRIFIEELPSQLKLTTTGVRLLTRMSVPIFIRPAKPEGRPRVEQMALRAPEFFFELKNGGNAHFQPRQITVKGAGANGEIVLERKIPGWYVLAGGSRLYHIDVPKSDCAKINDFSVEFDFEGKVVKERFTPPPNACTR